MKTRDMKFSDLVWNIRAAVSVTKLLIMHQIQGFMKTLYSPN